MDAERSKAVVERVSALVEKYAGQGLTEQDTKNALIEPLLKVFGWPKDDLERVRAEYRHTAQSNPVDYALLSRGRPVLLVEAKALDAHVDEHKYIAQVMTYANMAAAEWAVITNGRRWDLYAVLARGDLRNKRIFSAQVSDPDFLDWMGWITPDRVEASELDRFWRLLVAERTVRASVEGMFRDRSDGLVALLASQTGLHPNDVATALQTLRITVGGPSMEGRLQILKGMGEPEPVEPPPAPGPERRNRRRSKAKPKPDAAQTPVGAEPTRLPAPISGKKPESYTIGSSTWAVKTWRDLLVRTAEYLQEHDPDRYQGIFTEEALQGRKRANFSLTPNGMMQALPIPGGFAEGNQSASSTVGLINKLFAWAPVAEDASYTCRD
ncbi:MAG: type I restriction enzyme HsdR N-terminal domain-containing protein [Pseudomonadota bacterium]